MNFIKKNFQYVEMDFEEFVAQASVGRGVEVENCVDGNDAEESKDETTTTSTTLTTTTSSTDPTPNEWFYLRSLGTDPRKDVSDIGVGFPELAPDFLAPPYVPDGAFFSSVFRIASPGMQVGG